jgi:hypothetical protein
MDRSHFIVIYGRDPRLIETRISVLETAGFDVVGVTALPPLKKILTTKPTELLVLCHSLTTQERRAALEVERSLRPDMKVIVMSEPTSNHFFLPEEVVLPAHAGPRMLVETAQRLLAAS